VSRRAAVPPPHRAAVPAILHHPAPARRQVPRLPLAPPELVNTNPLLLLPTMRRVGGRAIMIITRNME
jgi:hypothetical protein